MIGPQLPGGAGGSRPRGRAVWLLAQGDIMEIGAVIIGKHPGRTSAAEITLFDGTGIGLQDLAVASPVVALAIEKGIATEVDF